MFKRLLPSSSKENFYPNADNKIAYNLNSPSSLFSSPTSLNKEEWKKQKRLNKERKMLVKMQDASKTMAYEAEGDMEHREQDVDLNLILDRRNQAEDTEREEIAKYDNDMVS
jgi:hypothetical protein